MWALGYCCIFEPVICDEVSNPLGHWVWVRLRRDLSEATTRCMTLQVLPADSRRIKRSRESGGTMMRPPSRCAPSSFLKPEPEI